MSLSALTISKTTLASLENEIEQYGACDPAQVQEKRRAVVLAREATMRWTGESRRVINGIRPNTLRGRAR